MHAFFAGGGVAAGFGLIAAVKVNRHSGGGVAGADVNRHFAGAVGEVACVGANQPDEVDAVYPAAFDGGGIGRIFRAGSRFGFCRKSCCLDLPVDLLVNDHFKRFGDTAAFGWIGHADLAVIDRIGKVAPDRRRRDAQTGEPVAVVHNTERPQSGSDKAFGPPEFAAQPFRNQLGSVRRLDEFFRNSLRPRCDGESFGEGAGVVIFAAAEKQINAGAERGGIIGGEQCLPDCNERGVFALESVIGDRKGSAARPILVLPFPPAAESGLCFAFHIARNFGGAADRPPVDLYRTSEPFGVPAAEGPSELVADGFVVGRDDDQFRIAGMPGVVQRFLPE